MSFQSWTTHTQNTSIEIIILCITRKQIFSGTVAGKRLKYSDWVEKPLDWKYYVKYLDNQELLGMK